MGWGKLWELFKQNADTPSSPAAGYNKIYPKSDNKLYILHSDGTEVEVVEGGTINATTINTLTSTTVNATTFDTNVANAAVTLSGTTLAADGTDGTIDITLSPKSGTVNNTGAYETPISKGPAIINSGFAGTVTAAASTTVTFSSAADAILAGYSATNSASGIGTTLISNALTRYIMSWTNSTTCVVNTAVTWAGTAITSVQLPISSEVTSAGVLKRATYADGTEYIAGNVGIGTTNPTRPLTVYGSRIYQGQFYQTATGTNAYTSILFNGADTTATGYFGIGGQAVGNEAMQNRAFFGTQTSNDLVLMTSDQGRVYIASSTGNVGIANATPSARLSLGTGTGKKFLVYDDSTSGIYSGMGQNISANHALDIFGWNSGFITFGTMGTDGTTYSEKMRIQNSGNVGIGTTAPDKPLEINAATGGAVRLTYNDANGSASTYVDLSVDSSGNLSISPTGKTIIMPDAGKILWDLAPASDHTASGNIASETVGDAVAFGDVLYLNAGESKWKLADADASSTMPGMRMAVATIADDGTGNLMSKGVARDDSWSWTPKEPIYVSTTGTTGNTLTQTAPSGESDVIQIAGYALTATTMWFEPQIITTEVGIDAYDYSAETAIAITPSLLTAVPRVYFGNNASNQTYTLGALSAADVGKKFTVMKSGTGAGTAILQLPASTYAYSAAASSSAAGTVTLATAAYGSMTFMVTSATTIQLMNADGSLAFA